MITEDYVSFETAKLLKEKGFDENCAALYDIRNGEFREKQTGYVFNNSQWENFITAPTLQMAMKWLRKEYKIFICILFLEEADMYGFTIEGISFKKYLATSKNDGYSTYEEAYEAAIKYCLENLI